MDAHVNIKGEYTPKVRIFLKICKEHLLGTVFLQTSPTSDQVSLSWYKQAQSFHWTQAGEDMFLIFAFN